MPDNLLTFLLVVLRIYFSFVMANPINGLFDSDCFISEGECPNENVTFWLYKNETRNSPLKLDPINLNRLDFQPRRAIKILIHGYAGDRDISPNSHIRPVLLDNENVYVITTDYGPLARSPCYLTAVENLPIVSKCLAQLINNMVDQSIVINEDIHVIGFSLGAHVAGQTPHFLKRKLKRITGLDPAKPLFITVDSTHKLDPSDAEFVDVIHTDVLGRGMLHSLGHADFYPNIGLVQPGCQDENDDRRSSCNHDRAPRYYAESITNSNGFWSYSCPSWLHYVFDLCNANSNDAIMGYFVNDSSAKGSYFLKTSNKPPYGLGPTMAMQTTKGAERSHLNLYTRTEIKDENFEPQINLALPDLDKVEEIPDFIDKDINLHMRM